MRTFALFPIHPGWIQGRRGATFQRTQMNIKRLMDIGCYRGLRHRKGLPLRGQRTKTNARTRKGKKKTVANKRKLLNNYWCSIIDLRIRVRSSGLSVNEMDSVLGWVCID